MKFSFPTVAFVFAAVAIVGPQGRALAECTTSAKSGRDQKLCKVDLLNDEEGCLSAKGPCRWICPDGTEISRGACPTDRLRRGLRLHGNENEE